MTTIPLSMREGHGQTLSGGDAALATAHADDDGKLDALIDSVAETITRRDAPNGEHDEILLDEPVGDDGDSWRDLKAKLDDPEAAQERGPDTELDRALKVAVERRAGQETESSDFRQSREWRDALKERYGGRVTIGELLDNFADWHERLKADPLAAADAIASAYLDQPAYALPDPAGRIKQETPAGAKGETSDQKLNGILAAAIDKHHGKGDGEPQAFVASARHRAALKEMFPGMTYAEACRRVVALDADLHRDPVGTAGRLAATYRMPVTASQQVVAAERVALVGDAQQAIATAVERLPGLADMEDDVITVLNRPDFLHGPDMQQNLQRAYRIAQSARHERRSRKDHVASTPPATGGFDDLIAQAMQGARAS